MSREKLKSALLAVAEQNGFDEEVGTLEAEPYKRAGLFRDAFDAADLIDDEDLDDDELDFLREQVGVILITDSKERTVLRCYTSEDALEDAWEDLRADLDAESSQEEGSDDEFEDAREE